MVALVDGGVVAGYVQLKQTSPVTSHEHVLLINGLAVHPEHQRRGFGRRLVEAAVEEARRRGARKLSLRVLDPNTGAAPSTRCSDSLSKACCAASSSSTARTSTTC